MTEQVDISTSDDLCDALCDLRGVFDEARNEVFPNPSSLNEVAERVAT